MMHHLRGHGGLIISVLLGCRTEMKEDTGREITYRPEDTAVQQPSSEENALRDVDADGYLEDVDCDDWNPNIYPGAEETLNQKDDDCDGYVDADGRYAGSLSFTATAIYQGTPYNFAQTCTGWVERIEGQVWMNSVCEIDQTQERALQLLGRTIEIEATENFIFASHGEASAGFVSTGGELEWDAMGTASWDWSSWDEDKSQNVDVQVRLDALHLDILLVGTWVR